METTKITKEQLNLFVVCGKHYVNSIKKKSRLWIAIDSILPKAIKLLKKIEQQKEFERIALCKKTLSKHIEYDKNGRMLFTEEDNKKLLENFGKIDQELVSIPCLIVDDYPEDGLSYDIRKAFEGIVIPVPDYDLNDPDLDKKLEEENKLIVTEEQESEEKEELEES